MIATPRIRRSGAAREAAEKAAYTISKIQRWLHEAALKKIEPDTGLYHADGNFNYQDAWADCYPFLVWAAWLTDLDALNGPVRGALHAEIKHCQHGFFSDPENAFGGSEYVKDGLIAVSGWQEQSQLELFPFLEEYIRKGVQYTICTDISKDGLLAGTAVDLYQEIRSGFPDLHLIASGGVTTMNEVEALAAIPCFGVIIGKAIYEQRISLKELTNFVA